MLDLHNDERNGTFSTQDDISFKADTDYPAVRHQDKRHRSQCETRQLFLALMLKHHLHQLLLELPGRVIFHSNLTGQLQVRGALLSLGQQIDGEKPFVQRQLGAVEDGPCGQRGLVMKVVALVYQTAPQGTARGVGLRWTGITRWLAQLIQRLAALFQGAVIIPKVVQTLSFLKLKRIFRHDGNLLLFSRFHYAGTTGSIAEPGG